MVRASRIALACLLVHLHTSPRSAFAQEDVLLLACGDSLRIELRSDDPVLAGKGRSRRVRLVAGSPVVLFLWTSPNDLDLVIRVQDAAGKVVEDDDSGGGTTPCVILELEPGAELVMDVAAKDPLATGALELCARCAHETDDTRAAAADLQAALEEAREQRALGRTAGARELLSGMVAEALAVPGARDSTGVCNVLRCIAVECDALEDARTKSAAWGAARELYERILPQDHSELQQTRTGYANAKADLGELQEARALQEQVLEVYTRTLLPSDPELHKACMNLAATCSMLGERQRARELQEQALSGLQSLPAEDPALLTARMNRGMIMRERGDIRGALAVFEEVAAAMARSVPPDDIDLLKTRINLAGTLYLLGLLDEAAALYEELLERLLRTQADDHPAVQLARQGLAVSVVGLGDYARACELQEQVVEVLARTMPADSPSVLLARHNLAGMAQLAGDLARARRVGEEVLAGQMRTLPADSPDIQGSRIGLAGTLKALGDLHGARLLEEQALEVLARTMPADHPYVLKARQNLALTISQLGDLHGARALIESMLEILERTRPDEDVDVQGAKLNLAGILQQLKDLDGARALLESVLQTRGPTVAADHLVQLGARANLGLVLRELGDHAGARAVFEELVQTLEAKWPDEFPDLVAARLNLAGTLQLLGENEEARVLGERALEALARTHPPGHPDLLVAQRNLLCNAVLQRDPAEVQRRALELVNRLENLLGEAWGHSANEFEGRVTSAGPEISVLLWSASGAGVVPSDPELERSGFALIEGMRSVALLQARLLANLAADPALERLRAERRGASEELVRRREAGAGRDELQESLLAHDRVERNVTAFLSTSAGAREFLVEPTAEALARGRGKAEALVAYWQYTSWEVDGGRMQSEVGRRSLLAFVLKPDGQLTRIELGAMKTIEEAVARWRETLLESDVEPAAGPGAAQDPQRLAGERVRSLVFDPLLPALGDARTLVIALDDVLHTVPLDALPRNGGVLGENTSIRIRASLRELLWPARVPPEGGNLVAFGGIDYDQPPEVADAPETSGAWEASVRVPADAGGARAAVLRATAEQGLFPPLDASASEVRQIERLFGERFGDPERTHRVEGRRASRAALAELAPNARWLHLATHGWFAGESAGASADPAQSGGLRTEPAGITREDQIEGCSPMVLCGLALAGANRGETNLLGQVAGTITAEELATLDLSNCELAVLSACDTNVGIRRAGQGVASLQKALHMAGVRSVITSLWKVPDYATRELMESFYRRLWLEQKPKAQALWEAKMELRERRDAEGRALFPMHAWAGWVLTGEPQ